MYLLKFVLVTQGFSEITKLYICHHFRESPGFYSAVAKSFFPVYTNIFSLFLNMLNPDWQLCMGVMT